MFTVTRKKASPLCRVEFVFPGNPGKTVLVAGSFNDWTPEGSVMTYDASAEAYFYAVDLQPGYYEYKFVVDGRWILDEENPSFSANDFGTLNSVITIE